MAGVTDKPFRMLCKRLGAGLCVSEMTTSEPRLWHTSKSVHRMDHVDEPAPISVQIAGTDPRVLAEAARYNVDHGAQIIDINMGCPAKKVCNVWAGFGADAGRSAGRTHPRSRGRAVDAPVTLKIRTGWNRDNRNGLAIARIAEDCGIAALAVHGRTRADQYLGEAEYETIAAIKAAVRIPVLANGDVDSPRARALRARLHRRGRGDGRSRGAGPAVDLPRDRAFPGDRRAPARRPRRRRCATSCSATCEHLHAFYGELVRRAHRPQAPGLVREGPAGERGLPRRGQSRGKRGRADPADA